MTVHPYSTSQFVAPWESGHFWRLDIPNKASLFESSTSACPNGIFFETGKTENLTKQVKVFAWISYEHSNNFVQMSRQPVYYEPLDGTQLSSGMHLGHHTSEQHKQRPPMQTTTNIGHRFGGEQLTLFSAFTTCLRLSWILQETICLTPNERGTRMSIAPNSPEISYSSGPVLVPRA